MKMAVSDSNARLIKFIREELVADPDAISDETDLLGSGHIDSMGIMRLVNHLESEFGVSVPPEDVTIENFETVTKIASYLEAQTKLS
ncbi:MAG: acyl carrier protein [Planctomycetota bacterium]